MNNAITKVFIRKKFRKILKKQKILKELPFLRFCYFLNKQFII